MRWVDIDQLDLPDGWQQRSDQALSELRNEVNNAELEAQRTGENVQAARKKAISNGLDKSTRKKIWRDLAPDLAKLQEGKCWYSESKNSGSDKDVDHFRPKNRVDEDPDHERRFEKIRKRFLAAVA
jgi:5-methylcytosine-specific restriction endonuclease McrA